MDKMIEMLNDNYRDLVTRNSASDVFDGILEIVKEYNRTSGCPLVCDCTCCKFHVEAIERQSSLCQLRFLISDTILTYRRRNGV